MAYSVSAGFKTKADDPQEIPTKKFTFIEGVTDRTDKLLSLGVFNQKQFEGDELTGASLTVEALNDSKEFNFLIADKTNVGKIGKVELGFDAEFIDRFRGTLEEPEFFTDQERPKVRMVFSARTQKLIDTTMGSNAFAVDFSAVAWNPADLAWEILTTKAGLDATASTANVDIDYQSFLDYKQICTELGFSLRANFTGESVAGAMRVIGELTDALIYGETDGKVRMVKFIPEEAATPYLFTDANAHLQFANMFFNKDRLRNRVKVWHGFVVATKTWAGSVTFDNATSQTNFGLKGREFARTDVWHDSVASANAFAERYVDRYSEPVETTRFQTKRGTQALIHQLGDNINLTWGQVDYAAKLMRIYGIVGDLSDDSYEILAEDIKNLNSNFFILDSATNGELDTNVLF